MGVGKCLGNVFEEEIHLGSCLEPFLLAIAHAIGVVQVFAGREAEEQVVSLGIIFVEEVRVVGADELYAVLFRQIDEDRIDAFLYLVSVTIGNLCRVDYLVPLQLDVIVVAPNVMEPLDGFFCALDVAVLDLLGNFATNTSGADDEAFVELLQILMVGTRSHIEAIDPGARDEFDEVVIARQILGENNEMPAGLVLFAFFDAFVSTSGNIHLAAEDGFEGLQVILRSLLVDLLAIVIKLFDPIHVAMIGECHSAHSIGNSFIDHAFDGRLPVEQRVLRVNV